jgi:hypothetical protein
MEGNIEEGLREKTGAAGNDFLIYIVVPFLVVIKPLMCCFGYFIVAMLMRACLEVRRSRSNYRKIDVGSLRAGSMDVELGGQGGRRETWGAAERKQVSWRSPQPSMQFVAQQLH